MTKTSLIATDALKDCSQQEAGLSPAFSLFICGPDSIALLKTLPIRRILVAVELLKSFDEILKCRGDRHFGSISVNTSRQIGVEIIVEYEICHSRQRGRRDITGRRL